MAPGGAAKISLQKWPVFSTQATTGRWIETSRRRRSAWMTPGPLASLDHSAQFSTVSCGMAERSLSALTTVQLPRVKAMAAIIMSTT